jgi:hypothetical protein
MKYATKKLGCHKKKIKKIPLLENLESWFSVYNLILKNTTRIDKITLMALTL